jgi:ABC-type spermidine/putrescine transport system permease subunit I
VQNFFEFFKKIFLVVLVGYIFLEVFVFICFFVEIDLSLVHKSKFCFLHDFELILLSDDILDIILRSLKFVLLNLASKSPNNPLLGRNLADERPDP